MKSSRLVILAFAVLVSAAVRGQLFHPLGLGFEISDQWRQIFQPQMYVEGDILYVCTWHGLYSKDLSNNGSEWQLAGFDGIPVLDYVRRGDDIFALCFNDKNDVFLLSHDGGITFEEAKDLTVLGKQFNIPIIIGGTNILNSKSFLAELNLIKNNVSFNDIQNFN